jgi:hypothetical protein
MKQKTRPTEIMSENLTLVFYKILKKRNMIWNGIFCNFGNERLFSIMDPALLISNGKLAKM